MKAKNLLFVILHLFASLSSFSQRTDSLKPVHHFTGAASVTNNGISLVPSFSLGKPATIFLLSLGGERFSIDPDIRFSLDGKPWTFLFWARYKLLTKGKFRINTGAHLGLNFRTALLPVNGVATETQTVGRYLAGELVPNFFVSKTVSIGAYYLYSHGIDMGTVRNTHFVILNTNFYHLPIAGQFYLSVSPQVYYLYQDGYEGKYATATITLARNYFPFSVSSILNKSIHSNIPGSKDFNSNVSLVYSFNRRYVPKSRVP